MSRIFLLIVMLFILNIALNGKDYDMDKIMPKKLVYAELPDDYPKELDELFIFYSDIVEEMVSWDCTYNECAKRVRSHVEKINSTKRERLIYLIWLAENNITEYFSEYLLINGDMNEIRNSDLFSWKDASSISIYPEKYFEYARNEKSELELTSLDNIGYVLRNHEIPIIEEFSNHPIFRGPYIFAKIEVLDSMFIVCNHPINGDIYYLKVKVLDAFGSKFNPEEILIRVKTWRSDYKFVIGNKYQILLYHEIGEITEMEKLRSNNFICDSYSCYNSHIHYIFLLKDNQYIRLAKKPYSLLEDYNDKNGNLDYQKIEDEFNRIINYLKGVSSE